jgi:hypothetical protein
MKRCSAEEAAALLRPRDTRILGFGPAQPGVLLEEMGMREDGEDLTVFGGLMLQLYPIFAKSGVHLLLGFFGPAKRALRDAGHDAVPELSVPPLGVPGVSVPHPRDHSRNVG